MNIDLINSGYVIDHIKAGKSMDIFNLLELNKLDCTVAVLKNVESDKMGRKDIIKIDSLIDLNLDILGYLAPGITVNKVENKQRVQKIHLHLPKKIVNVIKCKNPRCITSTEPNLSHEFTLVNEYKKAYACVYCESRA